MNPSVHRLGTVASTMDVLHQLAAEGAAQGTVVVAGSSWRVEALAGEPGTRRRAASGSAPCSGPRSGARGAESPGRTGGRGSLRRLGPELRLGLKWPNDLMLDDRKLGGVLCEARWHGRRPRLGCRGRRHQRAQSDPGAAREHCRGRSRKCSPVSTPEAVLEPLLTAAPRARRRRRHSSARPSCARLAAPTGSTGRRVRAPGGGLGRRYRRGREPAACEPRDDGAVAQVRAGSVELAEPSNSP